MPSIQIDFDVVFSAIAAKWAHVTEFFRGISSRILVTLNNRCKHFKWKTFENFIQLCWDAIIKTNYQFNRLIRTTHNKPTSSNFLVRAEFWGKKIEQIFFLYLWVKLSPGPPVSVWSSCCEQAKKKFYNYTRSSSRAIFLCVFFLCHENISLCRLPSAQNLRFRQQWVTLMWVFLRDFLTTKKFYVFLVGKTQLSLWSWSLQ